MVCVLWTHQNKVLEDIKQSTNSIITAIVDMQLQSCKVAYLLLVECLKWKWKKKVLPNLI